MRVHICAHACACVRTCTCACEANAWMRARTTTITHDVRERTCVRVRLARACVNELCAKPCTLVKVLRMQCA